ncbi:MAG: HDIG domain-containing protein [Deltaproteobacteria bacterium]|nr:HDIG domain-containing protein [Deltaproteobacteria bacterium]
MHAPRRHAGPLAGFVLSLLFGTLVVGTVTFDLFTAPHLIDNAPVPYTVRDPSMGVYETTPNAPQATYRLMTIRVVRGQLFKGKDAAMVRAYEDLRRPPSMPLLLGLAAASLLLFFLFATYLRGRGGASSLLRTQIALFSSLAFITILGKALLIFTGWSGLWIPLVGLTLPVTIFLGRRVGSATAMAGAILLSLLVPVDLRLLLVFAAEAFAASLFAKPHGGTRSVLGGTLAATIAGVVTFAATSLLLVQYIPRDAPLTAGRWSLDAILGSDLLATAGGPFIGGLIALSVAPLLRRALGIVSRAELTQLAHFEQPLLRRLATRAPGTWAHSVNMANMAEMAANAIGADGQLVRVGAYYHDLGKSMEPDYFIENQSGQNPHDEMSPTASAEVIISHVDHGVQLARKHKIPEAVTEFIATHHAADRLEYFWHKSLKAENAKSLPEERFRYNGSLPPTRETGILAICDAVEAASRTLTDPDVESIRKLVRQIVFTKLEKGILDESNLSMDDLRKISESMVTSLRGAMHSRVKYPWQEENNASSEPENTDSSKTETSNLAIATPIVQTKKRSPPPTSKRHRPSLRAQSPGAGEEGADPAWVNSPELLGDTRERVHTKPLGSRPNKS